MTIDLVVELLTEVFYTVMIVLLPVLGISLIVGIILSIFQAATSIQEMTLTFVPKIIITALTIILLLPFIADKVITKGKQQDKVKAIRDVLAIVTRKDIAYKVVNEIAPKYAGRNGGYTRLLHYDFRKGDAAPTAIVMLVESDQEGSKE